MTGPVGALGTPPGHYASDSGLQPFDIIDDYDLDFFQGNALKYLLRAGRKGDFNGDIAKAIHYLEEVIARLPQHRKDWMWEYVDYVDISVDDVIESFGLTGPLEIAVNDILSASLLDSATTAEYYYESALTALRAALIMSPEL